jgi:class 3 adenylate cyclase/tetratricopeptide (TPR) repeat protein
MARPAVPDEATFPASERLKPYVSRLAIQWLREHPEQRHRSVDGTLVFVDISGFTSLTERLAKKGKVGAEEMNDLLDAAFTDLLSVAYDYGAGVVKWGGDAILLRFDEDDHAARACRGAWEMQRTMREVGRLRTSAGQVRLGMSVGVHTGQFDFFFVGDLHRELVIIGAATNATVAAESAAKSGEIVISSDTASVLPPAIVGAPRPPGFLLAGAPVVDVGRSPDVGAVDDIDLARCVPVAIADHLSEGGGEAEHRPLTIAFLQFGGTDELLASGGGDAVAEALEQCLDTVEGIALEYKVAFFDTDVAAGGGKIMLVAGAPTSSGNDEERMLRALRAISDAQLTLPLAIGVNRGRIFAANFGPPYRRTYSFKGDAANLAARLMAKAAPGQVLATDDVLARSRTGFEVEPLEPFPVKGKTEPVQAFALGPVAGTRVQQVATPLVGREEELQTLLDAVESARAYEGRIVEMVGDPGIGKSRLVEALREEVRSDAFIAIQCDEYEASTPYYPFQTLLRLLLAPTGGKKAEITPALLRRRVAQSAPHLLPWLPLLSGPLGVDLPDTPDTEPLEGEFRRRRLEETVTDLLGMLLLRPTIIVFEDVHWLDEASAELLTHIAQTLDARPWAVVATRRDRPTTFSVPEAAHPVRICLEPLTAEASAELIEGTVAELHLPTREAEALAARAGGNPLFLTELLAAVRRAEDLDDLPDSVEALMMREIDRLSPPARRMLRSAAVIGATFELDLLQVCLGEPWDEATWASLGDFVLHQDGSAFRFRHMVARDTAYEGLPYRRRRELHERVGRFVETGAADPDTEAELLSLHFFHAHDFARSWRYSRIAGDRAQRLYANAEAATFFERALEAVRHLDGAAAVETTKIHENLGDVRLRLGEFARAARAYRAARQQLGTDAVEQARLLLKEAMVPFFRTRFTATVRWLKRGLRILDGVEGTAAAGQRARLAVWFATTRQRQGRPNDALTWCRHAIADAERADDARHALGHAYVILDWAYLVLGRPEEATYLPSALAIFEELGDLEWISIVLNNMGGRAYEEGRWDECLDLARRAVQAKETIGDRWSVAVTSLNIAEVLIDQGRLEEAEPLATTALRVVRAAQAPGMTALANSVLGRIAARRGRFEEARSLLEEAGTLYLESEEPDEALRTEAAIAECLVLQGEAVRALSHVDATRERSADAGGLAVLESELDRLRGCALLQLGLLGEARLALDDALGRARRREADSGIKSADYEAARTLDALVRLGDVVGGPSLGELSRERDEILTRLGVVALPELPLSAAVGLGPGTSR